MCTVDKMLIKGIRSFSPENQAVITFFKPLTLIVGPNGAGKTTIIECLKCATTGELPPNARSGHSFIHDPKVAHITETKGQIKLRFRTAAGKDVVSVRNFSLTQKTSKMEFKAIESVLQTINSTTGERVSLSYRCADMDREIPLLMGVPKAVLENVIFVHQDDANWPLAEPALLKKKFDDIFSATKYTKALEALKKVHKEQAQLIKEMKLKAENLRNILDTSLRLQEGIKADSGHSERLVAQIERLEGQIAERRVRQGEVESGLARLRQLKADLQTQEGRLELLSRQKVQQRANIMSDNDESDEKLEEWRREFEGVVAKLEGSLAKTTRELSELRIQQEAERESSERDKQLVSRLQVEKERDRCLQELFSKHDLGDVGPVPLANDQAVQLGSRAASRLTLLQEQWDEMKRGQQEEERRRGAEIEAAGAEIVKAEGQLQMAQERKRSSEARRQQVQEAMERSSVDEDGMARLEREEKKSKAEADRLATKLRDPTLLSNMEDAKTDLSRQEQRLKALQREKDSLAAESSERVTLRLKQETVRDKEAQLKKLLAENKRRIEEVLGAEMPSDTSKLLREVEKAIRAQRVVYEEADVKAKEAGNEAAVQQQRLDHARSELNKHSNEMDSEWFSAVQHGVVCLAKRVLIQTRLSKAVDPSLAVDIHIALVLCLHPSPSRPIPSHLSPSLPIPPHPAAQPSDKTATPHSPPNSMIIRYTLPHHSKFSLHTCLPPPAPRTYETFVGMKQFVAQFELRAQRNHCCPTCDRGFTPAEEDHFVKKIRTMNRDAGNKEAEYKRQREGLAQQLGILDDLHPVYNEYRKLVDELVPRARVVVGHVEEAQSKAQENHENHGLISCSYWHLATWLTPPHASLTLSQPPSALLPPPLSYSLQLLCLLAEAKAKLDAAGRVEGIVKDAERVRKEAENGELEVQELEYRLDTLSQAMRSLADVNSDLAAAEVKR
ncbi:unnamed protein product [Closterium sp. NIES-53]